METKQIDDECGRSVDNLSLRVWEWVIRVTARLHDVTGRNSNPDPTNPFSRNRFDPFDFGHMVFEVTLDAKLQRDRTRWATNARTVESNLHSTIGRNADKLDIAAIGLHRRADEAQDTLNAVVDTRSRLGSWQRGGHEANDRRVYSKRLYLPSVPLVVGSVVGLVEADCQRVFKSCFTFNRSRTLPTTKSMMSSMRVGER